VPQINLKHKKQKSIQGTELFKLSYQVPVSPNDAAPHPEEERNVFLPSTYKFNVICHCNNVEVMGVNSLLFH